MKIPSGKHIVEDIDDFEENSFICDFSKEDLSLILDGEVKKTTNKKIANQKINPLNQTTNLKLGSPSSNKVLMAPASKQKLVRSKSNYLFVDEKKNPLRNTGTEKKIGAISRSRISAKPNEKRDPTAVIQ